MEPTASTEVPVEAIELLTWSSMTVRRATKRRLASYKSGTMTWDVVLNDLMDRVPVEQVGIARIGDALRSHALTQELDAGQLIQLLGSTLASRRQR